VKIAISADGGELTSNVGHQFGQSGYLIVIDLNTMSFKAIPNPISPGQSGAGVQMVAAAVTRKVKAVLTGYCSPTAESYLSANKIEVLTGISGTVEDAVEIFRERSLLDSPDRESPAVERKEKNRRETSVHALRSSFKQLTSMLPILFGIVLLIGLANIFLFKEFASSLFTADNWALDSFIGAFAGSFFAGNPINSYIIGKELLEHGASLVAVTALIIAWVNVGLVQLPAEIAALGFRFALIRNAVSFLLSIIIAVLTAGTLFLF